LPASQPDTNTTTPRTLVFEKVNFTTYLFSYDKLPINYNMLVFFPGKMCSDRRKNHGCGQKKTEGTSSAIFGVGTAAKCCDLKRCADRVRSRTDNKDEVLEGKFRNLNNSPSTK